MLLIDALGFNSAFNQSFVPGLLTSAPEKFKHFAAALPPVVDPSEEIK